MAEERYVVVANVVVGNSTERAVANVIVRKQVLFVQVVLSAICGSRPSVAPDPGQRKLVVAINDVAHGCFDLLRRYMAAVDEGKHMRRHCSTHVSRALIYTEVRTKNEDR